MPDLRARPRPSTPSPTNPLGVKGVGETGTIASTAAVMNAVVDALAPFGVTDIDMPATPERSGVRSEEVTTMIPAPFDYEVAESVDARDRAPRLRRGRQAPRRRPLAPPAHAAALRATRRCSWTSGGIDDLSLRARGRRHARDRRADPPPRPRARRARCSEQCPIVSYDGRADRRPAGAPPRHDRRLGRARRSGLRPPDGPARARRRARRARARRRADDSPSASSSPASSRPRSTRRRC